MFFSTTGNLEFPFRQTLQTLCYKQFIYEVCCLFKLRSSEIKCGFVKSNLCGYSFIHNKATHSPSLTIHSVQVVMMFLLINQFIIIYLLFMLNELEWTKIITTNWLFQAHDNQHHKVNTMDEHTICAVLYYNMTLLQYDLSKLNNKYWTSVSHLPEKWIGQHGNDITPGLLRSKNVAASTSSCLL